MRTSQLCRLLLFASITGALTACPPDEQGYPMADLPCVGAACQCPGGECSTATLEVSRAGAGLGEVVSEPAGIDCGSACALTLPVGQQLALTAVPGERSFFAGWSGDCSGTGECVVALDGRRAVQATFEIRTHLLEVGVLGTGTGTILASSVGIQCGSQCQATLDEGTEVTLSAVAGANSAFTGWSGACTGTGSCSLTMTQAASVKATFNATSYLLTVTRSGSGSGTVLSSPAGINCGSFCSAQMPVGGSVSLSATPLPGDSFTGWSGACSGTGTCVVAMNGSRTLTASFAANASGTLDSFGTNLSGCTWLDPDPSSTYVGVLPRAVTRLSSGALRLGGTYVTPTLSASYFQPWFAGLTANGQTQTFFGSNWNFILNNYGTVDELEATPAGTLVARVNNQLARFTSSSFGPINALPLDIRTMATGSPDAVLAVNDTHLFRVVDVVTTGGGTLDPSFGQEGQVELEIPGKAAAMGIAGPIAVARVLRDGTQRVYLVATASDGTGPRLMVMRYTADGILDTSFEQGVAVLPDLVVASSVHAGFDSNRTHLIVVAGSTGSTRAYRFTSAGRDLSWGDGGSTVISPTGHSPRVAVLADGRSMVAVSISNATTLYRLLANGTKDGLYFGQGYRTFNTSFFSPSPSFVRTTAVAVTPQGATLMLFSTDSTNPRGALCQLRP